MAEYETIKVKNILSEEFQVRFNGELYTLDAKEEKSYPKFLGFHVAKYMSDKVIGVEAKKLETADKNNPYAPAASQLMIHDNPRRRTLLFDILGDAQLVEDCVNSYPLKAFIGDMTEYLAYVDKATTKTEAPKKEESKE